MRVHLAACFMFASLLACALPASAEQSVEDDSAALVASAGEFDEPLVEEQFLHSTIDISGGQFVSARAATNWAVDVDALAFRPSYGEVSFVDAGGDDSAVGGIRLSIAWESEEGIGIRSRVTGLAVDGRTSLLTLHGPSITSLAGYEFRAPTAAASHLLEIAAATFDLEMYKHFETDNFDIAVGAGNRSANFTSQMGGAIENEIAAVGVSAFAEMRQLLYRVESVEWSLVAGGRGSFLFGEWENNISGASQEVDTDLMIGEAALGVELSRKLGSRLLSLRAQYEYQQWDTDVTPDMVFNGAALRAGINW